MAIKLLIMPYILISQEDNEKQLIVFLSSASEYIAIKLGKPHLTEMGISTQMPGELWTASGKGYWPSTPDDPPQLTIRNHAISFFMFESAGSVFIWNENKKKFKQHWISD